MSLTLIAETFALLYHGKTEPDFTCLIEDAEKLTEDSVEQLEPKVRELEGTVKSWFPKRKIKEEEILEKLSEVEQQPATNIFERVVRLYELYDNRLGGEIPFTDFKIDKLAKQASTPNPRQLIQEMIYSLPPIYRPEKRILDDLSGGQFLVACAIIIGQLCGMFYLRPPSTTELHEFVPIFGEMVVIAAGSAKELGLDTQDVPTTPQQRKRPFKDGSPEGREYLTTDTKADTESFEESQEPYVKRLRPRQGRSSQTTDAKPMKKRRVGGRKRTT
jgi:hypothetical protein